VFRGGLWLLLSDFPRVQEARLCLRWILFLFLRYISSFAISVCSSIFTKSSVSTSVFVMCCLSFGVVMAFKLTLLTGGFVSKISGFAWISGDCWRICVLSVAPRPTTPLSLLISLSESLSLTIIHNRRSMFIKIIMVHATACLRCSVRFICLI